MAFAWKQAGLTYNRYLAVAARVVRRSLKEGPRLQAEKRGEMELRFAKWDMSLDGRKGGQSPPCSPAELQKTNIRPSGKHVPAQDVTGEFNKASKGDCAWSFNYPQPSVMLRVDLALHIGNIVKDETFTLFEAVGALEGDEMMDPKMDSGYLVDGETLEDDYNVLRDLLPGEAIGVMDQLLCFEMAWHMGFPLSQSLFNSYYIDCLLWPMPKSLDEARFDRDGAPMKGNELLHVVLRAYCLGLIKTCDFVHRMISAEKVIEEEDFVSHLFHRNLLSDIDYAEVQDLLSQAIKFVENDLRPNNESLKKALHSRLCLRQSLLHATNIDDITDKQKDRYHFWDRCLPLISQVTKTNTLAVDIGDSYSIKIQRRLASTTPPRPIVQVSFSEAINFLERMCQGGRDAYRALNYQGPINLENFVWAFQSRTPQPPVYTRSLLQSLIWSDMKVLGQKSFKQLIFDDFEETVLAASILINPENDQVEAPHHARFKISQQMDTFVRRVADAFLDIYVTLCMNRSRLRRILCHLVLEWETIQLEAENTDAEMRRYSGEIPGYDKVTDQYFWSYPLSQWACYHKLRIMQWIIQMGFELDIYQVDEMAGMYWFLQHVANARLEVVRKMYTHTKIRAENMPRATKEQKLSLSRATSYMSYVELETSAMQCFADGLSCLYSFLAYVGLIPSPYHALPYSQPALRYQLRMKPFAQISHPPIPSFEQFIELVSVRSPEATSLETTEVPEADSMQQAFDVLRVAESAFKQAWRKWEQVSKTDAGIAKWMDCEDWWRASVKNVLRSCIAANVAIATARKAMASVGSSTLCEKLMVEIPETIDALTFANLQLFAQFAAAGYCPSNADDSGGGKKLTCPTSNNCPLVEADDVTTVYEFENSLLTDVTGYIATDSSRSLTVLAFRGSESVRNFLTDAKFPLLPAPDICAGCALDAGFYLSWNEAKSGVLAALAATAAANPSYRVVITGHSLGGAIGAIAAVELRNAGRVVDLYTYGQPRIGDDEVSDYISNQNMGGNYRVTHYDDPVPRLPPLALGFRHISPEYYIQTGNYVPVTAAGIQGPLTGNVNFSGNTGNLASLNDIPAHGWYFNNISSCNPSDDFEFR
ncbi:MAG: hypothetical protein Q9163_000603 [Psora crenata]